MDVSHFAAGTADDVVDLYMSKKREMSQLSGTGKRMKMSPLSGIGKAMNKSPLSGTGKAFLTSTDRIDGLQYPHSRWCVLGCVDQSVHVDGLDHRAESLPTTSRIGLEAMPVEILRKICGYLEPIWLWNLSHVCALTFRMLSFERGNYLWYDALPSSLWSEAEHFQDDAELDNFARERKLNIKLVPFSTAYGYVGGYDTIPVEYAYVMIPASDYTIAHYVQVIPGYTYHYYLATSKTPAQVVPILGLGLSTGNPQEDLARGNISTNAPITAVRRRVQALGGAYEPVFNYKREITTHIKHGKRCFICLSGKVTRDEAPLVEQWGISWCSPCLEKYTTSLEDIRPLKPLQLLSATSWQPCIANRRGKPMYYLPEINGLLRQKTGLDLHAHKISSSLQLYRRESKSISNVACEKSFSEIRLKIVTFAKMLWEGQDPDPEIVIEEGRMVYKARPGLTSPDKYRVYRERFAPTANLARYLFPERLLTAHPETIPYSAPKNWLYDPTKTLPAYYTIKEVGNRWVSDAAHTMIQQLTAVWERDYDKKFGGHVDAWCEAATAYQIHRLEEEIRSGAVAELSFVPKEHRHLETYLPIRRLRAKTELQDIDQHDTAHLHKRTSTFLGTEHYSFEEYRNLERASVCMQNERRDKLKYFNKIIRETCNRCPRTNLVFAPKGLEGLVEHMRKQHRKAFYETDDFHVIG